MEEIASNANVTVDGATKMTSNWSGWPHGCSPLAACMAAPRRDAHCLPARMAAWRRCLHRATGRNFAWPYKTQLAAGGGAPGRRMVASRGVLPTHVMLTGHTSEVPSTTMPDAACMASPVHEELALEDLPARSLVMVAARDSLLPVPGCCPSQAAARSRLLAARRVAGYAKMLAREPCSGWLWPSGHV
ncbi:hypothetical protein Dimus_020872 [Dionaea muscipula]